jgi:hypothetical protein
MANEILGTSIKHTPEAKAPEAGGATVYVVNGREQAERPRCAVPRCERFADSPWTTCQEHWR